MLGTQLGEYRNGDELIHELNNGDGIQYYTYIQYVG